MQLAHACFEVTPFLELFLCLYGEVFPSVSLLVRWSRICQNVDFYYFLLYECINSFVTRPGWAYERTDTPTYKDA